MSRERQLQPLTASPEYLFRGHCWFLWDVWQAEEFGNFPQDCQTFADVENNDAYRRHCRFLAALQLRHPIDRKLFHAGLWHLVSYVDDMHAWDGGAALRAQWVPKRDALIASFDATLVNSWSMKAQHSGNTTVRSSQPQERAPKLLEWADQLLDRLITHTAEVRYELV